MANFYHYTIEYKAALIFDSGQLIPTGGNDREKDLLWFSLNTKYEPTAIKPTFYNGEITHATFAEYAKQFTLWRYVLSTDKYLMSWGRACEFARTPNKIRRSMERVGKAQGANPRHWFALSEPVDLYKLTAQIYDANVPGVAPAWRDWLQGSDRHPQPAPGGVASLKYADALKESAAAPAGLGFQSMPRK